jgi:taurine dioxygenase
MNVVRTLQRFSRSGGRRAVLQSRRHLATLKQDIEIRPIAGSLGAEVLGVDLKSLDDTSTKQIRDAFLEHKVVFFRDQQLEAKDYLAFASKLGQPTPYPFVPGIEGYPEITHVLKREHEKNNFGGIWHSDTVYLEKPPMGTMLLARELPPYGGDTLFANQVAAYEALSGGLKATLERLTCVHTSAKADVSKTREDRVADSGQKKEDLVSYHPAVRTHPETGKKVLYLNVAHTERFDGWTEAESVPLLRYLHEHQIKPEFTCRFKWDVGSLAFWDNRQVLHNPINDYQGFRRSMHRITLAGEKPA